MRKTTNKIVALLLVVVMAATLAVPTFAAEPEGTAITNAAEFLAIKDNLEGKYYLANDIDLSGVTSADVGETNDASTKVDANINKVPLISGTFKGTLDGNGFALNGVKKTVFAFFSGTATDLTVNVDPAGVVVSDREAWFYTGLFSKEMGTSTLTNVHVNGDFNLTANRNAYRHAYIGGFAGRAVNATVTMNNCSFNGSINVNFTRQNEDFDSFDPCVGGLFGMNKDYQRSLLLTNVSANVDVNVTVNSAAADLCKVYAGGILAYNGNTGGISMENCLYSGNITVTGVTNSHKGQLVGYVDEYAYVSVGEVVTPLANDCVFDITEGALPACGGKGGETDLAVKNSNIKFAGTQQRVNSTDSSKYDVRMLLVVDGLDYESVGFNIGRSTDNKQLSITTTKVYESIIADGDTVTAAQLNGAYIVCIEITGVPAGVTFYVEPTITGAGTPTAGTAGTYTVQ